MAADTSSLSGAAPEWSFPTASLLQTVPRNVRSGWASCRALQSPPVPGDQLPRCPKTHRWSKAGCSGASWRGVSVHRRRRRFTLDLNGCLPELQMVCTGIEPLKWREQLRAASRLQQPLRWILGETILKLLIWDYN